MSQKTSTGLGLLEVLAVIFIVLKLLAVINWSWWWVLSPILIPIAILLGLLVIGATAHIFK